MPGLQKVTIPFLLPHELFDVLAGVGKLQVGFSKSPVSNLHHANPILYVSPAHPQLPAVEPFCHRWSVWTWNPAVLGAFVQTRRVGKPSSQIFEIYPKGPKLVSSSYIWYAWCMNSNDNGCIIKHMNVAKPCHPRIDPCGVAHRRGGILCEHRTLRVEPSVRLYHWGGWCVQNILSHLENRQRQKT